MERQRTVSLVPVERVRSTKRFVDDYEYIRIYLLQDFFDSVQADVGGG